MFGTAPSDGAISHPRSSEGGAEGWFAADAAHSRSWVQITLVIQTKRRGPTKAQTEAALR